MRAEQGLDELAFAWFLEVPVETVLALEQGDGAAFPPAAELQRVVARWLGLAGLDPRPLLAELSALAAAARVRRVVHGGAGAEARRAAIAGALGARARVSEFRGRADRAGLPPDERGRAGGRQAIVTRLRRIAASALGRGPGQAGSSRSDGADDQSALARRTIMPVASLRWAIAVVALSIVSWAMTSGSSVVAQAVSELPAGGQAIKSISDFFAVRFAPTRAGHRWIEVSDPRSRRADKLRIGRHSD